MCDSRVESTFNNRPPSVFSLVLHLQNFTETLQIEIRNIMIAFPLKTYAQRIWCTVCVYTQNHCFIGGGIPFFRESATKVHSHIILLSKELGLDSAKGLYHFWPNRPVDCAAKFCRVACVWFKLSDRKARRCAAGSWMQSFRRVERILAQDAQGF